MTQESEDFLNNWNLFRQLMPVSDKLGYFDHAAVAPLSGPAKTAITTWSEQACHNGDVDWPQWNGRVEKLRSLAASLIGSTSKEVAIVPNTTTGINLVAEGFPWQPGDNIVTLANEFPSNLYPWMNLSSRDVRCRRVDVDNERVDLDRIMAACDDRTRLISVSWVGYASGWRLDVQSLVDAAHQRGIMVFLDAIQGLGVFPLNVRECRVDFLAADGHKWMLGPEGAGIFYVRAEHLDLLRPLGVGWNSVQQPHDYSHIDLNLRREAARYEGGSQNMVGVAGFYASLKLLSQFGLTPDRSPIADRILQFNKQAAERLQGIGASIISDFPLEHRSGILAFDFPGQNLAALRQCCLDAGVVLSLRGGWLRISPHAYANESDLERLVNALKSSLK